MALAGLQRAVRPAQPALTFPLPVAACPHVAVSPALHTLIPPAFTVALPVAMVAALCGESPCGATAAPMTATGLPLILTDGTRAPLIVPPAVS